MELFGVLRGASGSDGTCAFFFGDLDSSDADGAGGRADDGEVALSDLADTDQTAPRGEVLHPHGRAFDRGELLRIRRDVGQGDDGFFTEHRIVVKGEAGD